MRSDVGFDRFISEGLKEAAGRVEVPAHCKTEIDMRIVSAESDQQTGGTKQIPTAYAYAKRRGLRAAYAVTGQTLARCPVSPGLRL